MCATCGCEGARHEHEHEHGHGHEHEHEHGHGHTHAHRHDHDAARERTELLRFETALLEKNARLAGQNRLHFAQRGIFAVNLMSSPGAGKTTLLEKVIARLGQAPPVFVIEGDQATDNDARRIRAAGAKALQINTGAGCHLDARGIARAVLELRPRERSLLVIENVGNLVCPALFDLGEAAKIVVVSVTEGEDKPLKYPHMFAASDVLVVNKLDLVPYVGCDVERLVDNARRVNPGITVFRLSATSGAGLDSFCEFLATGTRSAAAQKPGATTTAELP